MDIPLNAKVECTDGNIGRVRELVAEEGADSITHLVLQKGHLWGKREVVLPLSAVDRVEGDTVYLKLDKASIAALPAIPLKRSYVEGETDIELIARVFDDVAEAEKALEYAEDLRRRRTIKIINAAVLVKDTEGNVTVKDTKEIDTKKGRRLGAITGGLIGLLGGPAGVIIGALAGAGAGAVAGKYIDEGFSDEFLENLQQHLQPGKAALVLLMEHRWARRAAESMADIGGVVIQETISDTLVEDLLRDDADS
jgi:uncharacterized membrane protein